MIRRIGIDDALVVRVHVIAAEIKNLPLVGEVYDASTAIPAKVTDLVFLGELKLKCIVGDFFHFFETIKKVTIMPTIIEQISATAKINHEARVALFTALTSSAFDGMSKLIALNLDFAKASLAESTAATQEWLSVKDTQKLFGPASAQPALEKALAYGRQVASITSATQAEFSKTTEAAIAEIRRNRTALMEEVAKNAPAGFEQAFSLIKSTIDNTAAGYDALTRQAQQATGMLNGELMTAAKSAAPKTAAAKANAAA